jgi:hypothetical protein
MGMQAYAKYLRAHKTPSIAVVTQIYFDESSATPKLYFKPVRPLTEEELQEAVKLKDTDEAHRAITMTVAQTDKVQAAETPLADDEISIDDIPAPEPKKVSKKAAAAPAPATDLGSILDEWD